MLSRSTSLLACLAALAFALFVVGCAKPMTATAGCSSGQLTCGSGSCVNAQTDPQNCGSCGKTCGNGSTCEGGSCVCASGYVSCGGSCVASNTQHCGNNCTACPSGDVCNADGTCSSTCTSGTKCSDNTCSSSTNPNDCGSCDNVCPSTESCISGTCSCGSSTQMNCSGTCVDITSTNNCGSCGNKCGPGQSCNNGSCTGGGSTGGTGGTGPGTGGTGTGTGGTGTGTGGTGTGTGGSTGTGGTSTGTGGTTSGATPAGYYKTADWNVKSVDWHGCVWTGIDSTVTGSTTTITPKDFTAASKEGGPYEVNGTVYNDYNAVALLGFNLNEATTGSSTQCVHNTAAATQVGPPDLTVPSSSAGIAVNWSETKAPPTSFRIQIQASDQATTPAHRWCATIKDVTGPSFIPWGSFYPQCWNVGNATMSPGTPFNPASDKIDAVSFLVPGSITPPTGAPFDFTIVGFAPGASASDAPKGGTSTCGMISGMLGSASASTDASFQRAAVTGSDCKEYIVQNNNWGNPAGSTQTVNYTGTSFTVQSSSGSTNSNNGQPVGAPASFPSTFVGANGNIAGGTYNTWTDTGLPKQISAMQSVMTQFTWSGGKSNGDYNATYDVWFANSQPTPGYADGVSGFLMVWLYKPSGRTPIGNSSVRTASIADSAGTAHTFNVYVGPRGSTTTGTGPASRPVVSYVASSTLSTLSFDLKKFIDDAVSHADTNNGVSGPFSNTWYLTDVFAGFEIWTGGDGVGLKSTGFSIAVK